MQFDTHKKGMEEEVFRGVVISTRPTYGEFHVRDLVTEVVVTHGQSLRQSPEWGLDVLDLVKHISHCPTQEVRLRLKEEK